MSADHEPLPPPAAPASPPMPEDTTGQALAEALRSSFVIIKILMAALVVLFLCSGMFTVGSQERAIILRFGKPVGAGDQVLLGPGFHWAFPAPIDEVVKIPAGQVRTATSSSGWYFTTPELALAKNEPPPGESLKPGVDGYVLTADANIIHVLATVRYRIVDPVRFEFRFTDAAAFITNALNDSINYAAAYFPVDSILTRDVASFRERFQGRLNSLIDQQQLGIVVEQSDLRPRAPRQAQVATAFNAVTDAGLKSGQGLNEALSYANNVRSRALGEASGLTNTALSDMTRMVEYVAAEAKQFVDLRPRYEANPVLVSLQRQADALGRAFTNAYEKFYIAPGTDGRPREIRLLLSREPEKSGVIPPPPPAKDEH